ncbi:regulatory LuxR family protein [Micromonospora pisi]|uniref:Regulatory LuxR family protein n=1 Tax=Micromonospora pisi TaxID=589240 RepID=A0A495JSQ0_9ACTN|nr:helix-turn-helix transcriptional regulator [Micromonospora pisi]RKR91881.1 regulatory LuxR family protein [Micromonospora pisi]
MTVQSLPTTVRDRQAPVRPAWQPVPSPRIVQPTVLSTHASIDAAVAAATREVLVIRTLRARPGEPVDPLRRADHENLRRGLRYRVILPDHIRDTPVLAMRLRRLGLTGAEIRTLPNVPADATVVDEALAMLPSDRRDGRPGDVAMFQLPSVVNAVTELFERLWLSAMPLTAAEVTEGTGLSERERELLALLSAGCTDESAAARLGISVRTVRRMMSAIMNRLGARSRFQAGLKAADRGWLA